MDIMLTVSAAICLFVLLGMLVLVDWFYEDEYFDEDEYIIDVDGSVWYHIDGTNTYYCVDEV